MKASQGRPLSGCRGRSQGFARLMPDVILPVLDEAEALPGVLEAMPDGYRPIVVDNGSVDGSDRIAARLGALVISEPRRGFGSACYAGLMAAEDDVICFMDCDGSLDPEDLVPICAALDLSLIHI
mgnify:FL=1